MYLQRVAHCEVRINRSKRKCVFESVCNKYSAVFLKRAALLYSRQNVFDPCTGIGFLRNCIGRSLKWWIFIWYCTSEAFQRSDILVCIDERISNSYRELKPNRALSFIEIPFSCSSTGSNVFPFFYGWNRRCNRAFHVNHLEMSFSSRLKLKNEKR